MTRTVLEGDIYLYLSLCVMTFSKISSLGELIVPLVKGSPCIHLLQ